MAKKITPEQRIERALEDFHAYKATWKRDDRGITPSFIFNGKHHTFIEMQSKIELKRKQITAQILESINSEVWL
ncbi:hypothetical protein O2604_17240 [Pseudomonas aeruginosa]|uniref:hypothetical protein n=1 Tax=Pseudomonas aeruginosa TaxID=287 RepID=UPI0022AE8ACD|nr:hypothetical protein [Pseudomonas aeruginosa]WAW38807.1 hypothetical protein O2604_17240 [Pseudomonas aeruginosa]